MPTLWPPSKLLSEAKLRFERPYPWLPPISITTPVLSQIIKVLVKYLKMNWKSVLEKTEEV